MKKLNYFLLGAAALALASCSQNESPAPTDGNGGNYHITVSLPEAATRAFGDGFTATRLHYAVYDADNNNAFLTESDTNFPADKLFTTVDFQLAYGKSYTIVFFAQSPLSEQNGSYVFDATDHTVYADYAKMAQYNKDYYDCFFQVYETGLLTNETEDATITLNRPVAQINWGVSDLSADMISNELSYGKNLEYLLSSVTVNAYTEFDMLGVVDGKITGAPANPKPVTFAPMARPTGETFPYEPSVYEYLSMEYMFAPASKTLYELTLTVNNDANRPAGIAGTTMSVVAANVPAQANYKTNIFGSLLTGDLNFKVEKQPDFNEPDFDNPL